MKFKVNENTDYGVDVDCTLKWVDTPPKEEIESLEKLIRAWFQTGLFGLYDGYINYLGDIKTEGLSMAWFVDMGSSDTDRAFSALKILFNSFNETSHHQPGWVEIDSFMAGK